MAIYNTGYELYELDQEVNPRGVFLIEAISEEAAKQYAEKLLEGQEFGFLDVYPTEHREGDIPVLKAE